MDDKTKDLHQHVISVGDPKTAYLGKFHEAAGAGGGSEIADGWVAVVHDGEDPSQLDRLGVTRPLVAILSFEARGGSGQYTTRFDLPDYYVPEDLIRNHSHARARSESPEGYAFAVQNIEIWKPKDNPVTLVLDWVWDWTTPEKPITWPTVDMTISLFTLQTRA